jgi:hypothetical protein
MRFKGEQNVESLFLRFFDIGEDKSGRLGYEVIVI